MKKIKKSGTGHEELFCNTAPSGKYSKAVRTKRVYVDEKWCLGCRLCEYHCAHANSSEKDMVRALKDRTIRPRIHIESDEHISFAVSCRHCDEPICVKSCIAGAISKLNGIVRIDKNKCVGCLTCVLVCPYAAIAPSEDGPMQKCELCTQSRTGTPACVMGCPNQAILFEEVTG